MKQDRVERNARNILISAAQILCRDGWIQGEYRKGNEGYDLMRAVRVAGGGRQTETALAFIKLTDLIGTWRIPEWNDDPLRTFSEVIGVLLTAANGKLEV